MQDKRRTFLKHASILSLGAFVAPTIMGCERSKGNKSPEKMIPKSSEGDMFFKLSLAQWSFHKALFAKELEHLDFAAKARQLGIGGIEYVNQFFKDKAEDNAYLSQMTDRATEHDVNQLLIMVDGEGGLGGTDDKERLKAVENHYKWVHAAKTLGCHSIRVNAYGEGSAEDVSTAAIDGLGRLATYAQKENINVIVENHGGYSSNGKWLSSVMKQINLPNCGTLPDFGNFCITREKGNYRNCLEEYDRYQGVKDLMPFAKAVSAKSHDFDSNGEETQSDYMRIMKIVKDAGYRGYVGIEYEGNQLSEEAGIIATRELLIKVGKALS